MCVEQEKKSVFFRKEQEVEGVIGRILQFSMSRARRHVCYRYKFELLQPVIIKSMGDEIDLREYTVR